MKMLLTTGLAILAVLFSVNIAKANDVCSNRSLNGSYGLHAAGATLAGNFAAVGRFVFDGNGHLAATLFVRVNGNNIPLTITGTYLVSPDCTVSDTWHTSKGGISTHVSVIVNNGQEYFILNDTSGDGSVVSGEAKRQLISN